MQNSVERITVSRMSKERNKGGEKETQEYLLREEIKRLKEKLEDLETGEAKYLSQLAVFNDIYNTVREGIAYTSLDGKVISINQALEKILDKPREKIIGRSIITLAGEMLSPSAAKKVIPIFTSIISGRETEPFTVEYGDKVIEVSVIINVKTRMITGIARDVTEDNRTLGALKRSEARLRRAELASRSGNWELHLDTGRMEGSEGAARLYGLDGHSIEYDKIKDIPLPEYRPLLDEAIRDLITKDKPYNIEFKIRKADTGEIIDIHSISEIDRRTNTLYGSIQEITDRKKIEDQLIKKNRDLSKLFDISLTLLESIERKVIMKRIVDNAASLVGTDTSAIYLVRGEELYLEATCPPLPEGLPDEFRKARIDNHPHIKKVIESKVTAIVPDLSVEPLTPEERLVTVERNLGSLVYIPLIIQNVVEGVIILGTIDRRHDFEKHEVEMFTTFSNITSLALENSYLYENLKVTKERAEESNRLKTSFLHNVSHEIRTPLNAIIGFSGLLTGSDVRPDLRQEYIDIISQSNKQLLSIIEDIINISQIEAGQVTLTENAVDLNIVLPNIYRQYYPESVRKGLDFTIKTSCTGKEALILTDENKLISILTNLLNNAFKFTHDGFVEIGCHAECDRIEFSVTDTGIGIRESEHQKIFDRFYQIEDSPTVIYGGMGLGLSISSAYVNQLGGKLILSSTPGKGSRFAFTIPYRKAQETKDPGQKTANRKLSAAKTEKTILVAEDEDSNYAFIEAVLSPLGYRTIRAFDGSEAIRICSDNPEIDLVLMDIRMPLKDGYESTSEILKMRPEIPIVAQTAYGFQRDRTTAMEKGCIDYLTKPFSREQLITVVRKYS